MSTADLSAFSRAVSHRALVGVDDLASGGKPHALMLFHMGDGSLQVFDAQRLARDHGMQRYAHDPWLLAAVGVERIELVEDRSGLMFARVGFAGVSRYG